MRINTSRPARLMHSQSGARCRHRTYALFALLVAVCCTQSTSAQHRREEGRQFVEGLLRTLIESQADRRQPERQRRGQPSAAPELVRAQRQLAELSQQSTRLTHHLHAHAEQSPASRQWLADALRLNASLTRIQQRTAQARRLEDLRADFRDWDRDWRLLAYRLRQTEGLGSDCLQCLERVGELETALCSLLGVTPQVDYLELMNASISVVTSLAHLSEDLQIELPHTPAGLALAAEGSQVHQRGRWFSRAVQNRQPHDELVQRFQSFYRSWRHLAVKIRAIGHRHLDRLVRRVDESSLQLHELLWLPHPVEYIQLAHLTDRLSADVERLFDAVSLNVLLDLPAADRVLPTASQFFGLCENFADSVATQAPLEQLRTDYRYLVNAWPELAGCFSAARRPEVTSSLRAIEESFIALRDTIGLSSEIDWRRTTELAASLAALSDRMYVNMQRFVLSRRSYEPAFRSSASRHAAAFRTAAHHLHHSLVQREQADLAADCAELADAWNVMSQQCYRKLSPADQARFGDGPAQIAQQVVQLQTMLQL